MLSIVAKRQHVDWRSFRHDAVNSPALAQAIERLCTKIVETLRERSLSREERRQFEAEAPKRAEEQERVFQEAEAKKQGDEQDAKRRREEAQTQRRPAQGAERRALESVATWPWRPSRRGAVVAGLLVAMVAAGAAAWWNQHQLKHEVQPQTAVTLPHERLSRKRRRSLQVPRRKRKTLIRRRPRPPLRRRRNRKPP